MANEFIGVVRPDGKTVTVTQKAFDLVYKKEKYTLAEEKEDVGKDVDYYTLSREELEKIKNDDLKAFLTKEEIDFDAKATKDDLISLIVGE
ncbi:hypothetical protein [Psychrobacillus psychrotolerans]|uniref:hypothetical protein n=1 Tax=Psychrobacillus psychrotolerans TaxID=126156 RepID=UPI003B025CD2